MNKFGISSKILHITFVKHRTSSKNSKTTKINQKGAESAIVFIYGKHKLMSGISIFNILCKCVRQNA